jgi:hypothetical protein
LIALLAAARGIVAKRTAHDWLIAAAASLIILLATTLLSAGLIYSSAVSESGLRRSLADADPVAANVAVSARVTGEQYAKVDPVVRSELAWNFEGLPVTIVGRGDSDSFGLPGQAAGATITDIATFGRYERIQQHASLTDGAWPAAGDGPVQVTISAAAADALGWAVGDEMVLTNRRDDSFSLPIRVVGIFQPNDLTDAFWRNDPQLLNGVTESGSYRTFGPLITEPATYLSRVAQDGGKASWLAFPDFGQLRIDQIQSVGGRVAGTEGRLEGRLGDSPKLTVASALPKILSDADRSLLVARTGVLILTVQLAVLAGYALLLTAGLLIDQRRVETALLRSRGASTGQVATLAFMEGVLLAVPAAFIGPWLAAASLRLLNNFGPLAEIGLDLEPKVTFAAYVLAALAGAACIVALVVPAFSAARSLVEAAGSRGRQQRSGIAQRAGLDLALLAVAAIGFWQLRHYGGSITASVQGQIGLDPFLVAAPAIGLLAGAVLALRLIPLLAQLLDRAVTGTRGLVASLGAWQVARRPLRYTRSALLLMLAIALGVFAVSYSRTWTDSQRDQANFQVGADLAVTPDPRAGATIPDEFLHSAYAALDGVEAVSPVSRQLMHLSRGTATGTLLALDAATAPRIVEVRSDMASAPISDMLRTLAAARPQVDLPALPGTPQRIRVDLDLSLGTPPAAGEPSPLRSVDVLASVVVRDAEGMLHRFDGPRATVSADLRARPVVSLATDADGRVLQLSAPLSLAALELRVITHGTFAPGSHFTFDAVELSDTLDGESWTPYALDPGDQGWASVVYSYSGRVADSALARGDASAPGMNLDVSSEQPRGYNVPPPPVIYSIQPVSLSRVGADPVPIIASRVFMTASATGIGEESRIDIGPERHPVRIAGSVDAFPTTDASKPVAVADLPTLALLRYQLSGSVGDPDQWWMAVADDRAASLADALDSAPFNSRTVAGRIDRAEALRTDPVALGVIGGLSLGFVSAALFATLGFVVSAAVSARERLTEFALLRALGLSPAQLSTWLSLENGILVAISLVGGTLLGLLMAWVALPYITVTQDASAAVPAVLVAIPWSSILLLEVVTVVSLGFIVLVLGTLLRRIGLGSALRLGED